MRKFIAFQLILAISILLLPAKDATASIAEDYEYYKKYPLYSKYEKYKKYQKYKKYKKYKQYLEIKEKFGFNDPAVRIAAKDAYNKYKLYKKDPGRYHYYAGHHQQYQNYSEYKKYSKYKSYSKYKKYKKYKKYSKYNKSKYEKYKKYGSREYKAGYERYKTFMNDLGHVTSNRGAEIRVGLWSYSKEDMQETPFKITANKDFEVTDCNGTTIGEVPVGENARVTYVGDPEGTLQVYNNNDIPIIPTTDVESGQVCFEASDGDSEDMIFDANKPSSEYDNYRGKIKLQYSESGDNETQEGGSKRIWVINALPLEHYIWGFGEIGGGVTEHSKAMLVAARTYARWYMEYSTKWAAEGFHLLSTSSSQIYRGYDYEKDHDTIPDLARRTNGIVMKNSEGDFVLAAYCSWSDGSTRKYEDGHWGGTCREKTSGSISSVYPELSAVNDPYGKHPTLGTCALAASGNHMVGMIANGSLIMARDHDKSYTAILSHYYHDISIIKEY